MTFKSHTQPFCRWCGKRIPKKTTHHYVENSGFKFDKGKQLVTLEEVKKYTNEQIVAVKYHYEHESYENVAPGDIFDNRYVKRVSGRRTVYSYSTWDGESYEDEFFCNGEHARLMGYAAAGRHHLTTAAWRKANAESLGASYVPDMR